MEVNMTAREDRWYKICAVVVVTVGIVLVYSFIFWTIRFLGGLV